MNVHLVGRLISMMKTYLLYVYFAHKTSFIERASAQDPSVILILLRSAFNNRFYGAGRMRKAIVLG